jgi:hypothetical protein
VINLRGPTTILVSIATGLAIAVGAHAMRPSAPSDPAVNLYAGQPPQISETLTTTDQLPDATEIPEPGLPDIATVRFIPGQDPVILYNPVLCQRAGQALCEFYRYHEYGHIALRHNERDDLSVQEKEHQADRWAAMHAPLPSVIAAYQFFSRGGGGTPFHGEGQGRADRMLARFEHP